MGAIRYAETPYVTRQHYYYSGEYAVEISLGRDGCGPDALVSHWAAEGQQDDVDQAVESALTVQREWQKWCDESLERSGEAELDNEGEPRKVIITVSNTGIHGMEGEEWSEEKLREWAEKYKESRTKCDQCGDPLEQNYYTISDYDDFYFCSEGCADNYYWQNHEDDEEEELAYAEMAIEDETATNYRAEMEARV